MKLSHSRLQGMDNRANVVEQILEQGQRLRNAMVKSILDSDPFYIDTINSNAFKKLEKNRLLNTCRTNEKDSVCKLKTTGRSTQVMSAEFSDVYCSCHICNMYKREICLSDKCSHVPPLHLLNRPLNKFQCAQFTDNESDSMDCGPMPSRTNLQSDTDDRSQPVNAPEEIVKSIQSSYRSKAASYFKYIDSMKITLHNISLNNAGNRKALGSDADTKYRLPPSLNQSYFVEYKLPDVLTNNLSKSNSKVDSGLTSNLFRVCSKKLQNEEIYFKHTSIHDIVNLQPLDLNTIEVKFQISTRAMKQKRSNVLGYATFNMRLFEIIKNMCCIEHLPILSEDFILGTLKVTVQLGCGRLYFGKEFVEFIENNRKDSMTPSTNKMYASLNSPSSDTINSVIYRPNKSKEVFNKVLTGERSGPKNVIEGSIVNKDKFTDNEGFASCYDTSRSDLKSTVEKKNYVENTGNNKTILYGLMYVSEANYFEGPINSYFSCQAFCLADTLCSRVVYNCKDPVFNFYQKVPFIYEDTFINYLRDSAITIDFWERYDDEDIAIGTSQLSLYQFYVTYRNQVITNTLLNNRLPVTIADWWEPICSPVDGKLYGQMKVLVAIGTATQIQNLEVDRGLKNESLSVTYVPIVPEQKEKKNGGEQLTDRSSTISSKKPNYLKSKKPIKPVVITKQKKPIAKSADKAVQSEKNMESQNKKPDENPTDSSQKDVLEALLTQLIEQKRKCNLVDSTTNTSAREQENINLDNSTKNSNLKKTADLLDFLNGALAYDTKILSSHDTSNTVSSPEVEDNFKAHIVIEGALHLPTRRKCKVKKNKKKNVTYEDSLPSTYVSFETVTGADLRYTDVVTRSANPQWDYQSDVLLPVDMLLNNQKRLIFKVWRKNNNNSLQPNIETDVILGFAALDLTVLLAGLPSVQGWFNIIDFSSKCNGQIKIHITPLENISKFNENKNTYKPQQKVTHVKTVPTKVDVQEPHGELLSRTLKRKFTELEEITQRLRSRLADVTKDDSDASNDDFADEFERDINMLSIEEDYDMLDLKSMSESSNLELDPFSLNENGANLLMKANTDEPSIYSKGILREESFSKGALSAFANGAEHSLNARERQLLAGKQHINSLLEKLTLLTANSEDNTFSNRYISGCSTNQDPMNIASTSGETEHRAGSNLDAILKPGLFNQICSSVVAPPSVTDSEDITEHNSSSTSLLAQFVNYRQAPDGAGLNTTSSSNNSTCFNLK